MAKKKTLKEILTEVYHFFGYDIWRITSSEISKTRLYFYNAIKILVLAIRGFTVDKLQLKASALTYYTLFAIVPVLALILAFGKGFGFQDVIIDSIANQFSVQSDVLPYLLGFVEKYLNRAQGGVFVGVGVAVLFFSVMSGFRNIETIFNDIWQVKKTRPFVAQFTTYFSLMLIVPIFIVASSGLSIFMTTTLNDFFSHDLVSPFLNFILKLTPYFINWVLFIAIFLIIPNTRVKLFPAVIAGVFTGSLFQIFQILYIKGQIFLSAYNAVYGGFAIIPLLLLWLQISWMIILLGAELSYAAQNISIFEYESDAQRISKRYKDFLTLLIMHNIIKRFESGLSPISAEQLSKENIIPIRLVTAILSDLNEVELLNEINDDTVKSKCYQPAVDINKITVSFLFDKLEQYGSENFKVDKDVEYSKIWTRMEDIKQDIRDAKGSVLIKDI